tara:strand:- start:408 stop:1250 length:843 start_codon:yes stop_codon:yes gene_type:complete
MPLWKPSDLGDLKLWLKSEAITGGDWKDSSKSNYIATSGAKPTLSTTRKNGKKAASFNGTSQFLSIADIDSGDDTDMPMDVDTGGFYVAFFIKVVNFGDVNVIYAHDNAGSKSELRMNTARKVVFNRPAGAIAGGDALSIDSYHLVGAKRSGDVIDVFYDDTNDTTDSSESAESLSENSEFNIGKRDHATTQKFFESDILEGLVIHAALSDDDIERVAGYISHKFDAENNLQAAHSYKSGPPTSCHCVSEGTLSTSQLNSNVSNPYELSQNLNIKDERND